MLVAEVGTVSVRDWASGSGTVADNRIPELQWQSLVRRVRSSRVTPVIGSGTSQTHVGSSAEIARAWARKYGYPGPDVEDLSAVAQFIATRGDPATPNDEMTRHLRERLDRFVVADIDDRLDPYRYLPTLPVEVFVTTNYDDLLVRGLRTANKRPRTAVCRWKPPQRFWEPQDPIPDTAPDADQPLVFHLHGRYTDSPSMVITTADYLDFLEQMAANDLLPEVVTTALAENALIFIGYSFGDTNFQLLLRLWKPERRSVAVLLEPAGLAPSRAEAYKAYFPSRLHALTGQRIDVFWGTAGEFCRELQAHLGEAV